MTVREILKHSAAELQLRAEEHQRLLFRAIEGDGVDVPVASCVLLDCPHKRVLKETLAEAVEVLDRSRKAFKSKQLETLRKKLTRVLAEHA